MISFTAADVGLFPAHLAVLHAAREALDITEAFLRRNFASLTNCRTYPLTIV
jgi:hypothetical protein